MTKPNHAKAGLDGFKELTGHLVALNVDKASAERIARRVAERYTFKARRELNNEGMFGPEAAALYAKRLWRAAA